MDPKLVKLKELMRQNRKITSAKALDKLDKFDPHNERKINQWLDYWNGLDATTKEYRLEEEFEYN